MNATATELPDELASGGHLFRVDSRGKYIPAASSASKGGIYYFELSKELENRILPNGRKVIEQVVNLETTDYEKALERAKMLVMERKAMSAMKEKRVLNSADLITESLRKADPNGGSPERVWDRFAKSETYSKKSDSSKVSSKTSFALIEKFASGKSLYDFTSEDAARFVSDILKTHSPNSLRKVYLPAFREIWNVSLPLISNPWYDCAKWDDLRKMISVSGHGSEVGADTSLLAFSEEYFRREASSGRKWERNTEGFMGHFVSHMGVKKVGEVTQEVAREYARRMVEDPSMRVNRNGRDRISKFRTMWAMLMPDSANPWDNVCYDVAVREFPKKETESKIPETPIPIDMPEVGFASSSQCFRCTSPERLWDEYVARHAMKPRRESTARSMFMRLWRETGLTCPKQIVTSVAEQYCRDTLAQKRSAQDDLIVLRLVWETIMPGVKNPWPVNISRDPGKIRYASESKPKVENDSERDVNAKAVASDELPLGDSKETVSETVPENQIVENVSVQTTEPDSSPKHDGITFDRMYAIWKEKSEGRYRTTTYHSYHTRLRRFAGWMLGQGFSEVGPDDVSISMAHAYLEYLKTKINSLGSDISVLRLMWDAAFPENRCRNPWKPIYEEVAAAEAKQHGGWASRFINWIRGLFR